MTSFQNREFAFKKRPYMWTLGARGLIKKIFILNFSSNMTVDTKLRENTKREALKVLKFNADFLFFATKY